MIENVRFLERKVIQLQEGGPYLLGAQFTLADVTLYPWFEQAATPSRVSAFRMPADCAGVARWCGAVSARPAVQSCAHNDMTIVMPRAASAISRPDPDT
jgi:glutathione S-transferase